uniref:F-box domain-containing protein n=1 Tax=Romanomermis culicivorax TaxID=13658 RepID=A0A915HRB5_ROMCU
MLAYLPDHILISIFSHLSLNDRLKIESVDRRFRKLISSIWSQKRSISLPDDLLALNPGYTLSSYWVDFGSEMEILLKHCKKENLKKIHFKTFRRLQIFPQIQLFSIFECTKLNNIEELSFGKCFITDKNLFDALSKIFSNLQILIVEEPYPLIYQLKDDTPDFLMKRIENIYPGLNEIIFDNNRVIEDIRYLLTLFPTLKFLTLKSSCFRIKSLD